MKGFIATLQFMTLIPAGKNQEFKPEKMIPYFPMAGIFIGILLALFDRFVMFLWSEPVAALLNVMFLVFITGAFHLDGLGDSADGLYGHRKSESALAIMKDSRIGVMGLIAIVSCLGIKWGGILGLEDNRSLIMVIIPAYSRASMLFGFRFLKYLRPQGGTGRPFFSRPLKYYHFWGLCIPILLSIGLGWKSLVLNGVYLLMVLMILIYYQKKISGVTGDMLGAMTETIEAGLLLAVSTGGLS